MFGEKSFISSQKKEIKDDENKKIYNSSFTVSDFGYHILKNGKILKDGESPSQMIERVVGEIAGAEKIFSTNELEIVSFAKDLGRLLDEKKIIFSTPILTNAGRCDGIEKPLSACAVPLINFDDDFRKIKKIVDSYHQEAMGTGFNFDKTNDPVKMLNALNDVAVEGAQSGLEDRPVGNVGVLSIDHPKIKEFISSKINTDKDWKFNISINIKQDFMEALERGESYALKDGSIIDSKEVFDLIVDSAHKSSEPGLIFMERLNKDNPTPKVGIYESVAPCAEVGLVPGETCQFGYINLGEFIVRGQINFEEMRKAVYLLVRALDNSLELSIERYSVKESSNIMRLKRKIGVGVCGLADMLFKLRLPYESEKARTICSDVMAFINYVSKKSSVDLGEKRGSFEAFDGSRYTEKDGFIESKYVNLETEYIAPSDWLMLSKNIKEKRFLRNCSTTALPPTGRSGSIIGASTGVEPVFKLSKGGEVNRELQNFLKENSLNTPENINTIINTGSCREIDMPDRFKDIFKTALEINPSDHLKMVGYMQACVDESVSKTINLGSNVSKEAVKTAFLEAYRLGLKGVTIHINKRNKKQPIELVAE